MLSVENLVAKVLAEFDATETNNTHLD